MTDQMLALRGVELCVETFGSPDDSTILLVAGIGGSMDGWDPAFCARLAAGDASGGRHVVRYDHRDTGRSTSWPAGRPGYTGADLTEDAGAVIDAVAGGRAHVVGVSAGGGIAQELAAWHPQRVASLTLISTSPVVSTPGLPPPAPHIRALFDHPPPTPDWSDPDAVVEHLVEDERAYAGPGFFDEDAARATARRVVARSRDMAASTTNHWVVDEGEAPPVRLADISAPTLVMHGTADPMFPGEHGEALAAAIPGARLMWLDGVGHQVPPPATWDVVVPAILEHTGGRR
jgi:pimeloyl-ACP methyl ester carboxylesterase